jgi:hypothetical protein
MDLSSHTSFFDHLVELVPAKYYLASEQQQVNLKYLKKSARDATKAAFKQQYKQSKRAKLDPDQAKTTLELQRQQQQGAKAKVGAAESDTDNEEEEQGGGGSNAHTARPAAAAATRPKPSAGQLALPTGWSHGRCAAALSFSTGSRSSNLKAMMPRAAAPSCDSRPALLPHVQASRCRGRSLRRSCTASWR